MLSPQFHARNPHQERRPLAKKPNYDFERRKKEQDRKAKKDAKREERLQRKRDGIAIPKTARKPPRATRSLRRTDSRKAHRRAP